QRDVYGRLHRVDHDHVAVADPLPEPLVFDPDPRPALERRKRLRLVEPGQHVGVPPPARYTAEQDPSYPTLRPVARPDQPGTHPVRHHPPHAVACCTAPPGPATVSHP